MKKPAAENEFDNLKSVAKKIVNGLLLLGGVLSGHLNADDRLFDFNISAMSVSDALDRLAEKTNHALFYQTNELRGARVKSLKGSYSLPDALALLLADTHLNAVVTGKKVIVVSIASDTQIKNSLEKEGMNKKKKILASLIGLVVGSGTQAVISQTGQSDSKGPNGFRLEELVVTATKRATSLQDTALSISAFTDKNLGTQGIENFEGFSRQTPGVVLNGPKNFQKFTIRGIQTNTTYSSNGEQKPVAVYIDEVPVSTFSIVTPDIRLYDVERVEVLRGPQGTAFGSGSMAGGVRVITKKADLSGFDSSIRVDGGVTNDGGERQRYSGMVNLPLVDDSLALRLVGYVRDEEGYIDNIGAWGYAGEEDENSSEEWGVRASLRWESSDDFSATLMAIRDSVDTNGLSNANPALGRNTRSSFLPETTTADVTNLNATFEYDLGWAELVSSTTYADFESEWDLDLDLVGTGFMPLGYGERVEQQAVVQEVRLVSSTEGDIEWLTGLFYLDRESDFTGSLFTSQSFVDQLGIDTSTVANVRAPGVDIDPDFKVLENTEAALFGEVTYHFSDTLSLTAGLRHSRFEYIDSITDQGFATDVIGLVIGGAGGVASVTGDTALSVGTGKQSATTKKISLQWQPEEDRTYYLLAGEGFRRAHANIAAKRASLINPNDPTIIPEVAKPDSLWNYEIGAKTRWMDDRLQANIAAYYISWDDIQVGATRPSDGQPYVINGGKAESKGLEAELLIWPSERLELGMNFTLADADIKSISQEDQILSGAVAGAQLASPEVKVSGFGQYTMPLDNGHSLYGRLDIQYTGDYPNTLPNIAGSLTQTPNPLFEEVSSYQNVNAQLGWEMDQMTLVLYGENILDNDDHIYINTATHTFNRYSTLRPRTIGLRLDWNL